MSLLQMSIHGAVLILAIIVVRFVAINKLPKKTFLVLWGFVLFRLLIPFSVSSVFSVYSLVGQSTAVNDSIQIAVSNFAPTIQGGASAITGETLDVQATHVSPWFVVWFMGMFLCAAFFIVSYLRCYFEFSTSLPVQNDFAEKWLEDHKLMRSVSIRQSDRISAPLTYGIIKPVILIPQTMDWRNTRQLQYIFLHEYVHIRRFDALAKLISALALCVHWFNPFVWIMYILYNRDIEIACDESVIRLLGESTKREYSFMLISMEAKKSGLMPFCNSFSKSAIEERIIAIMKIKKTTTGLIIGSLVLVFIVAILFVTSAPKTAYNSIESGKDIVAFVKNVSAESITVDITEYITDDETEMIEELNLTEDDMLDGYYFYNSDEEVTTWKCNEETVYTFIDWNGDFTDGEYPAEYTTTDMAEFLKYLETYENGEPGMPFFFTVENGYVKQIIEKPFS